MPGSRPGRDTFRAALRTKERKGKGTGLKTRHYKLKPRMPG